jgi:hypothetical protein
MKNRLFTFFNSVGTVLGSTVGPGATWFYINGILKPITTVTKILIGGTTATEDGAKLEVQGDVSVYGTLKISDSSIEEDGSGNLTFTDTVTGSKTLAELSILGLTIPTVSMTGGATYETGDTVTEVTLNWVCNKTMTTRSLSAPVPEGDRERGEGGSGQYIHEDADLTTNTTYTITVGDTINTATATTSITFLDKFYYGTSALPSLTNQQTLDLGGILSAREDIEFKVDGDGEYVYFLYPSEWGAMDCYVNGSINTHWDYTLVSITNPFGVTKNYNRYRSETLQYADNIIINLNT